MSARPEASPPTHVDVLIVGAGVSGISMACTLGLQAPGKRWLILDRRQHLGGTWDLFRYPGVRSDSDMLTYGFGFKPWQDPRVLADGAVIRDYLAQTAREHQLLDRIHHGERVVAADWSSASRRWTVTTRPDPDTTDVPPRTYTCQVLLMCSGYYDHDRGHTPDYPGIADYTGRQVHPQHWPADLDLRGRRVVVVGSGATAVTLVPALAATAAHVTMLQRTPSYVFAVPARDAMSAALSRVLPRRWVYAFARRRNTWLARGLYAASRAWPERTRGFLLSQVGKRLGGSVDMAHFTPTYMPWDQRLCIVPDGDLFKALRSGRASVETDRVAGFDGTRIRLASGRSIEADVLVSATGMNLQVFGGAEIRVDGQRVDPSRRMLYKGVLMEDVPNLAWTLGYSNLTWTLRADMVASYVCRLLRRLDERGDAVFVAHDECGSRSAGSVFDNLSAGYVQRAQQTLPRQGKRAPWRVTHHYPSDQQALLRDPIEDGVLRFGPS